MLAAIFTVVFISPHYVMQLRISEELRHGCDDPLLGLTYFDLLFDESCAFLDFLVLQQKTAIV